MADGKVPVRECVGEALRFVRQNWRTLVAIAAICAAISTVLAVVSGLSPMLAMPITIVSSFVAAATYGAFVRGCLDGFGNWRQGLARDGVRVWSAMAVVAFFLLIVFVVLGIPGVIVFAILIGPRYGAELQNVSGDQAETASLLARIVAENPGMILAFLAFYGVLWMALTSRLYLSAPASVEANRILTFETWSWTRGNMWRILGARLMLLAPAYIIAAGFSFLLAAGLGLDINDPVAAQSYARANMPLYAIYLFVSGFVQLGLYSALEAGLSTYLYRGLKPAAATPPV